jgi:predicted ribosomally synthesized peptide with nif11-like leader
MSQEGLQKFLESVRQDSSLQEQLKAEGADPVAIAKEAGFTVTKAELIREHASQIQGLSDEELEGVAGGFEYVAGMAYNGKPQNSQWTATCSPCDFR